MWITGDVELPDEILDAHKRGELVFFVGAGASIETPSNLPSFNKLAEELARRAAHPFSKHEGLDYFIGQLESLPQGFDAHYHAQMIISDPKSQFNSLHRALVDIAGSGREFRVVTTNYDNHLTSAARDGSITIPDTWYAPALPLGHDFVGLVHLHGSALRSKDEMILTDRDFGRAYLTEAWATRFLLQMFERFTVVFIGYSHDDVIMRYLALGLPSNGRNTPSKRFAFTHDPSNSKWSYLGIRPIEYPVVGNDHQALARAITTWTDLARMGQTDHRSRMRAIVGGGTTLPWPDRDYLHARLKSVEGVRDFIVAVGSLSDKAKVEWLKWAEGLPEFKALFSSRDLTESERLLGNWFAGIFIESPTLNGAGLQTVQRLGQSMSTPLYRAATFAAGNLREQDVTAGERWQALLASSIYERSALPSSEYLIPFKGDEDSKPFSMTVLRFVLRPILKLKRRRFLDESAEDVIHPNAEVTWNVKKHALSEYLLRAVEAGDPGDWSLGNVLEDAIMAAYDLLDEYHGDRGWDPLSGHRSAIEEHSQNNILREPLDVIIDALRDYGMKVLPVLPELPDRWWSFGRPLMQRLALHLVVNNPTRSADEKLLWFLDRTGLYAHNLKHESYQLLAATVGDASPSLKQRVLNAVGNGPDYPSEIPDRSLRRAYAKYNLLAWLTQADPDWVEVQTEFNAIQAENPDFKVREHPDFDTWTTSGTFGGKQPMAIEDFIQTLDQNTDAALDSLLSYDYSERDFDQPTWPDALGLARVTAEQRPDLGVQLWDAVVGCKEIDDKKADLWRAITEGWGRAELGDSGLEAVQRLTVLLEDEHSAYAIGRFLLDQIEQQIDADECPLLASMRKLARELWCKQGARFTHRKEEAPLSSVPLYLNAWPGFLAQYWGNEVDRRWRHSREDWAGLSEEEESALVALLNGNKDALDATQPAIAGQISFFFSADADFSEAHLLPIFNDPHRHAFGWYPFLHHPRWNDRLLAAGLFDSIVDELSRLNELPDKQLRIIFLGLIASVVSYAGIASDERERLLDQTVLASEGAYAADFAEEVARFLRTERVDGAEVWRRWLGDHLKLRIDGQPRKASSKELEHWANVVPFVGEFIPDAIELFNEHSIGLTESFFDWEMPEGIFEKYGLDLVEFFARRIQNTNISDYSISFCIRELVKVTRESVGDVAASPLIKAAKEKGLINIGE